MARPLAPATANDVTRVLDALEMLRTARALLTAAECPAALAKVASAIKSTEGALRHVQRRYREGLPAAPTPGRAMTPADFEPSAFHPPGGPRPARA